jgi:hypothetical protein
MRVKMETGRLGRNGQVTVPVKVFPLFLLVSVFPHTVYHSDLKING